ncbi:MAG: cation diffusion facilitator family transporter, partial [Bacteriovoracaceae bacterium]
MMKNFSRDKATKRVTLLGALVNSLLSVFQISFGLLFHSNALIMDGIHSFSDLFTDLFVLLMTKIGGAKPDENHPYGHGRFETMGVVVLGSALITLAILLGWRNLERLLGEEELLTPGGWALAVPFAAIVSKELLYRHTHKVGKRINSAIIMANAWHHRSDALSSVVVFIGVGLASFGLP